MANRGWCALGVFDIRSGKVGKLVLRLWMNDSGSNVLVVLVVCRDAEERIVAITATMRLIQ